MKADEDILEQRVRKRIDKMTLPEIGGLTEAFDIFK